MQYSFAMGHAESNLLEFQPYQMKLRKSEEDEMARLIGTDVIEKLEVTTINSYDLTLQELREQYNSMNEILCEMEETKENEKQSMQQIGGFGYDGRNAEFLNKEISFLIDNLRKVT